jgi:hypothetical protein
MELILLSNQLAMRVWKKRVKNDSWLGLLAHSCNPRYWRDGEDHSLRPVLEKNSGNTTSTNKSW